MDLVRFFYWTENINYYLYKRKWNCGCSKNHSVEFLQSECCRKNVFKTSYKSYQIGRPVDLKIQSRLISLERDISDVYYCCYVKLGAKESGGNFGSQPNTLIHPD